MLMSVPVFWAGVIISAVVAAWLLYRYVVPQSWRDWARAGMVLAFVIAFYAEMYGFPVTIYLLTRVFGLDVAGNFWEGNLWVYLTGTPAVMLVAMMAGYTIAAFGIMLVIAGWRELFGAKKSGRLATGGPYALMRHPQYTGIFLALFGEGVVHWPTAFSLAAVPAIVLAYVLLARKEEREMMQTFGEQYAQYRRRVPMFFPDRRGWRKLLGGESFGGREESGKRGRESQRRESGAR